jgi:hypothetical protein
MREVDKIAASLFDKVRSRFDEVNLGDESAKSTQDPEKARFFNFTYSQDGIELGNVTISLIDEEAMKVYFGADIKDNIKENGLSKDEWYDFLRALRKFAKRNMLSFDTRDIAKSNLQIKDVKQQSNSDATINTGDINVTESRMYGTKKHSFAKVGECTVRVVHSDSIDEEVRGARTRKIESIFIETPQGERFRLKHKNLAGATALAQHYSNGGTYGDEICEAINNMMDEMSSLSHFARSIKRRSDLDDETNSMATHAVDRYYELKNKLKRLRSPRYYLDYVENYMPDAPIEDDIDVGAMRERFVKKMYDDRFDEALPYVYRAHIRKVQEMNNPMAEEFEDWADSVLEGTWAVPDQESEVDQLRELMSQPFAVGQQGQAAVSILHDLIGDDELNDEILELASIKGPNYDCRPEILKWLHRHFPAIGQEMEQIVQQSNEPEPVQQPQPGAEPVLGTQQPAEQEAAGVQPNQQQPQPQAESVDPLNFIRTLAGLRK